MIRRPSCVPSARCFPPHRRTHSPQPRTQQARATRPISVWFVMKPMEVTPTTVMGPLMLTNPYTPRQAPHQLDGRAAEHEAIRAKRLAFSMGGLVAVVTAAATPRTGRPVWCRRD